MTVDRVGGLALALLALFTLEESYRLRLPPGSLQSPGPAYVPCPGVPLLTGSIACQFAPVQSERVVGTFPLVS